MIDTLKHARELESAGLNPKQAEKMVRAQMDMITDSVATKADLYQLRYELIEIMDRRFEKMHEHCDRIDKRFVRIDERFEGIDKRFQKIDGRFQSIDERFQGIELTLKTLETRLVVKLGGLMVTCMFLGFSAMGFILTQA